MGTNFYWRPDEQGRLPAGIGLGRTFSLDWEGLDDSALHIGKRSGAGLYCWDCGCPCVKEVEFRIPGDAFERRVRWHPSAVHGGRTAANLDHCPICLEKPKKDDAKLSDEGHPAGIELGFAKPLKNRPRGVSGASSFGWAQEPARVLSLCKLWPRAEFVVDEYGDVLTGREFFDIVLLCPLWWTDSIGQGFS